MPTFSLCMIVKNEEKVLERCLSSIADLMDEIIIVDTGSTDSTKEIASHFTDKIYDFEWIDDFSAARNFAFSKATMDYIYTADADEVLDSANHTSFYDLKKVLLPEVEIVQMLYVTPSEFNTTENFEKEYRPKLFKRLRTFEWQDPIHETVRISPIIYDSDIEILHLPISLHSKRDFSAFEKVFNEKGSLSSKLTTMYAKELFISGDSSDFLSAKPIFERLLPCADPSNMVECILVLAKCAYLEKNDSALFSYAFRLMPDSMTSELACIIGQYFMDKGNKEEAAQWFDLAKKSLYPVLDARCGN